MNTNTKIISGFLMGAALGTATGLILAPSSGKKTRKKLKAESKRLANELIEKANESLEDAKRAYNKKVDNYTKTGKASMENLAENIRMQ